LNDLDAIRLYEALQLFFELDDTVVDTGPAGCLHLAVVAQESVAGLFGPAFNLDVVEVHLCFEELAEVRLPVEHEPCAAIQGITHGQAIGFCEGLQDGLALGAHLDLNSLCSA
tara:strand:+ start:519 stop:857 length:339 start_codon:yes stop_codon:yes gene_type:complete